MNSSPALEAVVGKALAKVPADRFSTALEFKAALDRASLAPAAAQPKSSRRRLAIGLARLWHGVLPALPTFITLRSEGN